MDDTMVVSITNNRDSEATMASKFIAINGVTYQIQFWTKNGYRRFGEVYRTNMVAIELPDCTMRFEYPPADGSRGFTHEHIGTFIRLTKSIHRETGKPDTVARKRRRCWDNSGSRKDVGIATSDRQAVHFLIAAATKEVA